MMIDKATELENYEACVIKKVVMGHNDMADCDFVQITTKEGYCLTIVAMGEGAALKVLSVTA